MGIGKINDNYEFYDGYEDEPEIIISLDNEYVLHIWEGYFEDIFDTPILDGNGWKGFTRDYQQMEGVFSEDENTAILLPKEYLEDLMNYKDKSFRYQETTQLYKRLVELFKNAFESSKTIKIEMV